jgi:hypothetical protein
VARESATILAGITLLLFEPIMKSPGVLRQLGLSYLLSPRLTAVPHPFRPCVWMSSARNETAPRGSDAAIPF